MCVLQAELKEAVQLAAAKTSAAQAQAAAALAQNEQLMQAVQEAKQQLDAAGETIQTLTQQAVTTADERAQQQAEVSSTCAALPCYLRAAAMDLLPGD